MKVAIMQPYFLPYIGYFQLINSVDKFVIYDDIQFTKKGWINRNRVLLNGNDTYISLPLKKDSDYLNVGERQLADSWSKERIKLLNRIKGSYRKAPNFNATYALIEGIVLHEEHNLFLFISNSVKKLCEFMGIDTEFVISSTLEVDTELKSQDRVISTCQKLAATQYINAIGGQELYDKEVFSDASIELKFIKSMKFEYAQFGGEFIPWLSILDVLMFNELDEVKNVIATKFELI